MTDALSHLRTNPRLLPEVHYQVSTPNGLREGRSSGRSFEELAEEAAERGYRWTERAVRIFEDVTQARSFVNVLAVLDHEAQTFDLIPSPALASENSANV